MSSDDFVFQRWGSADRDFWNDEYGQNSFSTEADNELAERAGSRRAWKGVTPYVDQNLSLRRRRINFYDWSPSTNRLGGERGRDKRIRSTAGRRSERRSSQDEGSIAQRRRTDQTIFSYLLPGRRGFFRTAEVCGAVSHHQCAFHRYRS